jgi:hypothetical protein
MKYCVLDTEGTGLFDYSAPADAPMQPRMASLAMIFLDDTLKVEREFSAHSALDDAQSTVALLRKLSELHLLPEPKVHYAKETPTVKAVDSHAEALPNPTA